MDVFYSRSALKASAMLVPLLGVPLLFTIYRPPDSLPHRYGYEYFTFFVTGTQVKKPNRYKHELTLN